MNQIQALADGAERSLGMFLMTIGDFSDADLLVRPCPGANHGAWQIGHLVNAEIMFGQLIKPGSHAPAPPKFADKFNKADAANDDPAYFPAKAELIEAFTAARTATVKTIRTLGDADLDRPMPEKFHRFARTIGDLLAMTPVHTAMHLGQLQVIRRKLGKPILF